MANAGAGNESMYPVIEHPFFMYEDTPPSYIHQAPSPTLPIDAYLDHGDYGRADFCTSHPFGVLSPYHLQDLPDHVGGDYCETLLPFSFPSSTSPYALLNCNKIVTAQQKSEEIVVTIFTYLIYKDYEFVTNL